METNSTVSELKVDFLMILNPAGCCRRSCLPFPCRTHPYSCCLGRREHPCSCFLVLSTRVVSPADRAFGAQRFSGGRTGGRTGRRFAPPSEWVALRAAFASGQRRAPMSLLMRVLEELQNCICHPHLCDSLYSGTADDTSLDTFEFCRWFSYGRRIQCY